MCPERKFRKAIVNFSGGRTSGLMLRRMLDKYPDFHKRFIVCFCNTGKERNETLDFVDEVQRRWGVDIIWLEYDRCLASCIDPEIFPTERRKNNHIKLIKSCEFTHWFKIVNYKTASRNGEPFDKFLSISTALPTVVGRGCSAQLKIRTTIRYFLSIKLRQADYYIGIRKDEQHRAIQILATCENFLHPKFPLIDDNITVNDVKAFWGANDFDLRLKDYEGNCDLCFLKSEWKRKRIMRDKPSRADWWIAKEKHFTANAKKPGLITFRKDETYEGVLMDALQPEFNLGSCNTDDIPCSCAEKGFEKE